MEVLENKMIEIRNKFIKHLYDEEFIKESYDFLHSIEYFDKEGFIGIQNDIPMCHYIKEYYIKYSKKFEIKPKQIISQDIKKEEEGKSKQFNLYSSLLKDALNEIKRKEKELEEISNKIKHSTDLYNYERLVTFLNYLQEHDLRSLWMQKAHEENVNLIHFEEQILHYFYKQIDDTSSFQKLKNKKYNISYRINEDKTLSLRLIQDLEVSLQNFLTLIYETDVYPKWFPFCSSSKCLKQPGKAKKVVYLTNNFPIVSDRDFLIYGFGINKMRENRTILLLCKSIDGQNIFQDIFEKQANKKKVRGIIHIFGFEIKYVDENKVSLRAVIQVDPKLSSIPQSFINFAVKLFVKQLFSKMLEIAKKYEGSIYQNKNPSPIDKEFYSFLEKEINDLGLHENHYDKNE